MERWEYKREFDLTDEQLNDLGLKGWELVSHLHRTNIISAEFYVSPLTIEEVATHEYIFMRKVNAPLKGQGLRSEYGE